LPGLCSDAKAISVLSFFFFLRFFFCVENFESGCRAWALRVIGRILALLLVSKPILSVGRTVARDHAAHVGRSIPRGRAATHPAAHFQRLGRGHAARVGHRRFPFPRPARARAGSLHTGPGGQPARSPPGPGSLSPTLPPAGSHRRPFDCAATSALSPRGTCSLALFHPVSCHREHGTKSTLGGLTPARASFSFIRRKATVLARLYKWCITMSAGRGRFRVGTPARSISTRTCSLHLFVHSKAPTLKQLLPR